MKPVVIFDLDGTLCDISHRVHFVQREKKDWRSFNEGIPDDAPNGPVVQLYKTLWESDVYEIILMTGRTAWHRDDTINWLKKHDIPFQDLLMRAKEDRRHDYEVKEEMLSGLRRAEREIAFAVDDRQQVVDMFRRNGVICLQCDKGDF